MRGPGPDDYLEHVFDVDTQVRLVRPGVYSTILTDRWDRLLGGPLGGYMLAICQRGLSDSLPFPDPLVVSAFFLRPGEAGDAEVHVDAVRAGRRTATGEARLIQGGKERLRVLATFSDLKQAAGRTDFFNTPPKLPPPEQAIDPLNGRTIEGASITERIEFRVAEPPGWMRGQPSGQPSGELWARLKDGREPDLLTLTLIVDALPLAVLELGEPGSTTLELTVHLRGHPAAGWLACRSSTRHVIGGLHEEDVEIWDSSGQLVAQSRQLAMLA